MHPRMHRSGSVGPILRPSAVVTSVFLRSRQETGIPLDGQRLVYKGEVLGSGSVQECGLNEDDFLVVVVVRMPSRPSPTAALGNPAEGQRSLMHARQLLPETGHEPLGVAERVFAGSAARDDLSVHTEPARQQVAVELSDLVQALATTLGTREMMPSVPAQHSAHGIDDAHDDAPAEGSGEDLDEDDGGEEEGHALEHAEAALRQLVDMGFPENRARKALQICRGNAQAGMDWLLEHEGDPDIDDPLSAEQLRRLEQDMGRGGDPQDQQEAVERLVEMGFSEDDILVALDTCNHDFEAAAAWLLGDNGRVADGEGSEEDMGEADLLHGAMGDAHLHHALANPRVVAALQRIMQNPDSAAQHLHDPEVGGILAALGMGGAGGVGRDDQLGDAGLDHGQSE